jgi:tetratricopeptide (TPR) repeat protein
VGSKLAGVAAAALTLALASRFAAAEKAADLVKQGLAAYKSGDYPTAITALTKALELEPSFDTQFALAQAHRLAGECPKALPHYKSLLDASTDLATARLINTSMALCVPPEPEKPPPPPPPKPLPPPPPKIIVREGKPSLLMVGLIGGGALSLGASVGFFLASHENRGDADVATTFDDHVKITNRADRQRVYGVVTLAASAGMIGYVIYRWKFRPTPTTEVALTPSPNGGSLVAWGRF